MFSPCLSDTTNFGARSTLSLGQMNGAIEGNALKPAIDKVFAIDEVQVDHRHTTAGARFGKIMFGSRQGERACPPTGMSKKSCLWHKKRCFKRNR